MPFVNEDNTPIVLAAASQIYVGGIRINVNGLDPDSVTADLWMIDQDGRRSYLRSISSSGAELEQNPQAVTLWAIIIDAMEESLPEYSEMLAGLKKVTQAEIDTPIGLSFKVSGENISL